MSASFAAASVAEQSSGLITLGLLAGEASGDILGAGLMMALKARYEGTIRFISAGNRNRGSLKPLTDSVSKSAIHSRP